MGALNKKTRLVNRLATFEGGTAYARGKKQELFFAATTVFAGQDTFYESASDRDSRVTMAGREVAVGDFEWYSKFVPWLRSEAHIRTMSVMLAAEGVHARLAAKQHSGNRQLIDVALQRPDEPGEFLAYWISHYGKKLPQPVKRGVADAVTRMLNERQALRYDKPGDAFRLGDVIELTHPSAKDELQGMLFEHLITVRHNRDGYVPPEELPAIHARWELNRLPKDDRHAFARKVIAGDTDAVEMWRRALAGQWEWGRSWLG
jgi:hypothetical protein